MTTPNGSPPGVPAVYNNVSMSFAPVTLYQAGEAITASVTEVIDALNSITKTLSGLQLGWSGATAAEAKQMGDAWTACMTNLFGTGQGNDVGVLGQLIMVLLTAASNYDVAEVNNTSMFTQLASGLSSGTGGSGFPDTPVTDPKVSSVGENDFTFLNSIGN